MQPRARGNHLRWSPLQILCEVYGKVSGRIRLPGSQRNLYKISLGLITQTANSHAASMFKVYKCKLNSSRVRREVVEHRGSRSLVSVHSVEGEGVDEVND